MSETIRLMDGFPSIVFALGIFGQHLLVHREREIVIALVASQASPIDVERARLRVRAVTRIIQFLAALTE